MQFWYIYLYIYSHLENNQILYLHLYSSFFTILNYVNFLDNIESNIHTHTVGGACVLVVLFLTNDISRPSLQFK